MRHLLLCALVTIFAGCAAAPKPAATKRAVSLVKAGTNTSVPEAIVIEAGPRETNERAKSRRFEIESAALTRAFGRPRTVGAEVVLPEGFRPSEDLAIAYHVPDVGEDPARLAEHLASLAGMPRLVLVVLDPRGIYGHHAFVDSVNEGPHGEALVTDLVPVLEQHLFGGNGARRRFVTGVGLGGWSAIRLQLEYRHAFDAVYAIDPEPLDARCFYGADLTALDASPRLKGFRDGRVADRIASFESAIGARGSDGRPLSLLARGGASIDRDAAAAFVQRDPASYVRQRGEAIASRLEGKIHAVAREGDPYGRDVALRSFQAALEEARVPSVIRVLDSYDFDTVIVAAWTAMLRPVRA